MTCSDLIRKENLGRIFTLLLVSALGLVQWGCAPMVREPAMVKPAVKSMSQERYSAREFTLVPAPSSLVPGRGSFVLRESTSFSTPFDSGFEALIRELVFASHGLEAATRRAPESSEGRGEIVLSLSKRVTHPEGYKLVVTPERVDLKARTRRGLFFGLQTVSQLISRSSRMSNDSVRIPAVVIEDEPRFSYRGMHLDVGRHFFDVDAVKRFIDRLALYKFNTFHWHLTEDQGWRIEIKRYPGLTQVGGFRSSTLVGHDVDRPHRFDGRRYGGYYTQKEIREVVRYAKERFIEVIPEIELPGHSLAALAAYPELGCRSKDGREPGPYQVATKWGIFEDVFCPSERTFAFLEGVLSEVLELFPSEYIHIGGDEVPKTRWVESPEAQAVIKREGLKNEEELQSYFIRRIETFLRSQGRKLIGWDEILDGGLAPGATVMSWRGVEGGIDAAKMGHDVIMAPNSHLYFNTYQSRDFANEPPAARRFVPLQQVYDFEPIPAELSQAEAAHVLGAQGCLWTEYISSESHLQYMALPRQVALAEVLWSSKEKRNWKDFSRRLLPELKRLDRLGVRYGKQFLSVRHSVALENRDLTITLEAPESLEIRYTLDGTVPSFSSPKYTGPFSLPRSSLVRAVSFDGQKASSDPSEQRYFVHQGLGVAGRFHSDFSEKYASVGVFTLTDGLRGSTGFGDGRWLGFDGSDLDVTFDLGREIRLKNIETSFLSSPSDWILQPSEVRVLVSLDGEKFDLLGASRLPKLVEASKPKIEKVRVPGKERTARFLRIVAKNGGPLPAWHQAPGKKAWLFVDEVIVDGR